MITLYHAPKSRSSRFIWMLEELGVPYHIRPVSIFRVEQGVGAPDPANPHPDKRVPAIDHDGMIVAESVAIALHLADAFPEAGLAPAPGSPLRGPYLTWMAWYAAEMERAMFAYMGNELEGSAAKRRNYDAVLRRLETALGVGPYLLGDRFSATDILVSSALNWARRAFPASAAIDAYTLRCRTRPAALAGSLKDEADGLQRAA
jgi:glutathione S-transferase